MRSSFLSLVVFAAAFAGISSTSKAAGILSEGFYSGSIVTTDSLTVPLDVELEFTEQVIAGDPDEILPYKKLMTGYFVLDGESGPWAFTQVTYDLESGEVELSYSRGGGVATSGAGSSTANTSSAASGTPTLVLSGRIQPDGSIKGRVTSVRGDLGTFQIAPQAKQTQFKVVPKNAGHWTGTWTYADKTTTNFSLVLDTSTFANINPPDMELSYTPGRIGSATLGNLNIAFQSVVIDYFHNTIQMTYINTLGTVSSGTLTIFGKINGDEIDGTATSSGLGQTGTFKLRRVQ